MVKLFHILKQNGKVMQIKGTSISNISKFIKLKYPNGYDEWLAKLPKSSNLIFKDIILVSNWYDLLDGYINPIKIAAELFFNNDSSKAAYEISKNSSILSLQGVYKIFVKVASIDFVMKKAVNIFRTFYSSEAKLELEKPSENEIKLLVSGFKRGQEIVFDGISGWADGLFTVIKQKNYPITKNITNLDADNIFCEILINYQE